MIAVQEALWSEQGGLWSVELSGERRASIVPLKHHVSLWTPSAATHIDRADAAALITLLSAYVKSSDETA